MTTSIDPLAYNTVHALNQASGSITVLDKMNSLTIDQLRAQS